MKQQYIKPTFDVEYFSLSQTIADGCGATHGGEWGEPNHWSKSTCGWDCDLGILWVSEESNCLATVSEYFEYEEICYNAPTAGNSIFSS